MSIEDTLLHSVQQYKLLPANEVIVLAVSGGIDSVCLMQLLLVLQPTLKTSIHIATLDHQTRGVESLADATFVYELSQLWGLPCTVGHANEIYEQAQSEVDGASNNVDGSLSEDYARYVRYKFLAQVAEKVGSNTIVTAHHADDQAETVLQKIIRGTSPSGLRAMQFSSPLPYHPELRLVRPLLGVSRSDIVRYVNEHALPFRHDKTNDSLTYQRNLIRHQLLPAMTEMNPMVSRALNRLAHLARIDSDYFDHFIQQQILPQIEVDAHHITIPHGQFLAWHPAIQRRVCVWCHQHLQTDTTHELTYIHIETTIEHLQDQRVGTMIQWGGGITVQTTYDKIVIANADYKSVDSLWLRLDTDAEVRVESDRWYRFDTWRIRIETQLSDTMQAMLIAPANAKYSLRTRRTGDRFCPPNLHGHSQKLKDWFINNKIVEDWRDYVPLLMINERIAAILLPDAHVHAWDFDLSRQIDSDTVIQLVHYSIEKIAK